MGISEVSPRLSRRQMLFGMSAFAAAPVLTGCGAGFYRAASVAGSQSAASPTQPTPALVNPQPMPLGAMTAATLSIAATGAGTFASGFVGLAYEKETLHQPLFGAGAQLAGLFTRLGAGVLRLGGNTVDQNVWTPNGKGQTAGQIAPADVDALAAFLKATDWTCLYGVNLGGSATGATTPELAAAEAAYVAEKLGASLVGIEIGNECENYGDAGSYYQGAWNVGIFERLWLQYYGAIVAVTPNAPLTGPAAGSNVAGWTLPFGENVTRSRIGQLTQHYYRGPASSSATAAVLLAPDTAMAAELAQLKQGAQSIGVPFRMAEVNSFWNGGQPGVSDAYASALWAIDMVFGCAQGGACGVNFQGGNEKVYTPIADNTETVIGARPVYYGMLLATMAGEGTLLPCQIATTSLNVTSYAVKNEDGGLSLVIVNKDATANLSLSVTLPQSVHTASLQVLSQQSAGATQPSAAGATGITIQGAAIDPDGSFAPQPSYGVSVEDTALTCYVPALSAVLIQLS